MEDNIQKWVVSFLELISSTMLEDKRNQPQNTVFVQWPLNKMKGKKITFTVALWNILKRNLIKVKDLFTDGKTIL